MAEKDKLSKEVEEQIQSLASDVYIQIEEKLTQLIGTVMPKEPTKKINIEQEPAYLTLQNNYQASQNELAEKSKNLAEKTHQLEQNTRTLTEQLNDERNKQANSNATLKAHNADSATKLSQLAQENINIKQQLADEIDKQEGSELNFQVELTQNNINFTETIERLEHENILLKSTLTQAQEKLSNELNDKAENSSQTIEKLEQALAEQKDQLHEEQTKVISHNQQLQNQLTLNEKERLELQQEIAKLNERLAVFSAQELSLTERINTVEQQCVNSDNKLQKAEASWKKTDELKTNSLTEQKNKIKELTKQLSLSVNDVEHAQAQSQQQIMNFKKESEQKVSQLNEQLKQSQIAEANQQKIVADQQVQLVDFDEEIREKTKENQNYKEAIQKLNNEQLQINQQQLANKKTNDLQQEQQQQAQDVSKQQINQLEIKNQELTNSLLTEQADTKLYQKEVSALKSQVTLAQEGQENTLNRFNATREKQEKDNNQVRETIKYLRDENNDMITQNNKQKEAFIEKTSELEHKLTEYRLKFEYAQKQLTQSS